jgi:SseB protein C-terminal domain
MVQELRHSGLRFLREQDGPPERELKGYLIELFRREKGIRTAYLAQVAYAHDQENAVALCLRADRASDEVIGRIGQIFSSMFGAHEHLDILFLSDDQEAQLARCCRAFWSTP